MGFGPTVQSLNKKQVKKNNRNAPARSYINVEENVYISPRERDDDKNKNMTKRTSEEIDFTKPRDLYNRQNRLKNDIETVSALPNPDRDDILKHIQNQR